MNTTVQLLLLHLWFTAFMAFLASNIWGRMAERTYEARMRSRVRWFLMPGRLQEKAVWVRSQKVMSCFGLIFVTVVYVMVLVRVLG